MTITEAVKRLQEIYDEHGDLQFFTGHWPTLCRVEHDSTVLCLNIEVRESFGGKYKQAVAK